MSLVMSCIDYCNSTVVELPSINNRSRRRPLGLRSASINNRHHLHPKQLHWMTVKYRITLTVATPVSYRPFSVTVVRRISWTSLRFGQPFLNDDVCGCADPPSFVVQERSSTDVHSQSPSLTSGTLYHHLRLTDCHAAFKRPSKTIF